MFLTSTNDLQPADSDEIEAYVVEFLSGRELHSVRKQDKEYRKAHDRRYQNYVTKREEIQNLTGETLSASKKYREEIYNKQSNCDAQFINNLHTFKTCDAGSGYREEPKHYAMDFIAEDPCGRNQIRTSLKKLKISSKNKFINEWLNREDNPRKMIRRSFSCINLSVESLTFREQEDQEKIATKRRTDINLSSDISNVDVGYLAEGFYSLDTARLLREISLAMKFLIPRVNSNDVPLGDIKISKVLFSTDDHYAYVIPEKFNIQKSLERFSNEFKKWHENGSLKCTQSCCVGTLRWRVNVVLYLEEYTAENTQYRRARHICEVPMSPSWLRHDLYLEVDTGMLRVYEYDESRIWCLPQKWASLQTPIMEVRFYGATTDLQVSKHIESIRKTGRAKIVSIDRVNRGKNRFAGYNDHVVQHWSTFDTAVLQTYRVHPKPSLETLFCPEKDCVGMCNTDIYLEAPSPVSDEPLAIEKLNKLREQFTDTLVAYILPNTDPHQNERVPEYLCRMKYLSDFTGTGGFAVITKDKAVFWTDNQHFKIAGRELDKTFWTVKNRQIKSTETIVDWLKNELPAGSFVGFDPKLVTFSHYLKMISQLKSSRIELIPILGNFIDNFWNTRPFREGDAVKVMSLDSCGKSPNFKMSALRKELGLMKCSATVVSELDDVMWLLNLRGNDIPFSPLTYSYLFVTLEEVHLFIEPEKLDREAKAHLTRFSIKFHNYKKVHSFLSEWVDRQQKAEINELILLTPDTNQWIGSVFGEELSIIESSIVKKVKTTKNSMELAGMRACNIRHSVQMITFLHWLEVEIENSKEMYTEVEMAEKLEDIVMEHKTYIEHSLPTIFSSGEHCSLLLYKPDPQHDVSNLHQVLIQSGVHYSDGTACATRTIWESYPTEEFANSYTLVLKGHIKIANSQFPAHTTIGSRLDVLARQVLWNAGMDYKHETGHSVGHCLNIRDTQVIIDDSSDQSKEGRIEAGQVITLEPAFYEPGKYGIRIGNCYETVLSDTTKESSANKFLCFQPLTLIPLQTSILVMDILSPEEILWINRYHYRVFCEIGKILLEEEQFEAHEWLRKACEPI